MNKLKYLVLTAVAAAVFTACGAPAGNAPANNANSANTAKTVAAAPSKEDLIARETQAWNSWKAKNGKYFEDYLTDNAIGMGNGGRVDKAAIVKRISDPTCDVNNFSFSDEQMTPLGADAALLTYKATQDAKCGGKALPAGVWAATFLVRSGGQVCVAHFGRFDRSTEHLPLRLLGCHRQWPQSVRDRLPSRSRARWPPGPEFCRIAG